jgi:outer membrane lipoprotein LolB
MSDRSALRPLGALRPVGALRPLIALGLTLFALAACKTRPVAPHGPLAAFDQRVAQLQHAREWQLDGRTAVALGEQGWQASLDWRQQGERSEVHLAGPFGAGAIEITLTPAGVSVNGAPPTEGSSEQLEQRLGFEPPLAELRYWLLGAPAPDEPFEVTRNAEDRAATLKQSGWSIEYDRYRSASGDVLPAQLHLVRAGVRVKVAVDRWDLSP